MYHIITELGHYGQASVLNDTEELYFAACRSHNFVILELCKPGQLTEIVRCSYQGVSNMKFFTSIILSALALASNPVNTQQVANIYPETTIVTNLDYERDIVTVETCEGFLFDFYGCEDWSIGDFASVIFDSKGTPSILDDEIIMVKYSGCWDID